MILRRPVRLSKPGILRFACTLVKRADAHLFVAAEGSAFVLRIVIETLATLFTAEMRDARALGLGRGGELTSPKPARQCDQRHYSPVRFLVLHILNLQWFAQTLNGRSATGAIRP